MMPTELLIGKPLNSMGPFIKTINPIEIAKIPLNKIDLFILKFIGYWHNVSGNLAGRSKNVWNKADIMVNRPNAPTAIYTRSSSPDGYTILFV